MNDVFVLGDYNAVCYECAKKYKASQLKRNWKGNMVCERCYEPRHPQDFVRSPPAEKPVPFVQKPQDIFIAPFDEPAPFVPSDFDDPTT